MAMLRKLASDFVFSSACLSSQMTAVLRCLQDSLQHHTENSRRRPTVGSILSHRLRRWLNLGPTCRLSQIGLVTVSRRSLTELTNLYAARLPSKLWP